MLETTLTDTIAPPATERFSTLHVPPSPSKSELQQLSLRHQQIIRLRVSGLKADEIASIVGVTPAVVGNVLGCELAKGEIDRLSGLMDVEAVSVGKRIQELAPKAVEYYEKILSGAVDASVSLTAKTAGDVLDRAGYPKVQVTHGVVEHEFSMKLGLDALRDKAKAMGIIKDAQCEEIHDADFALVGG